MKRFGIVAGIFLMVCLVFTCVRAQADGVPQLINYQGYLTDKDGAPLATAEYTLSFSIYTAPTGGAAAWGPQTFNNVPVVRGYFNVILPINDVFQSNATTYLQIVVNNGSPIAPRQQILSAPYAMNALNGNPSGTIIAYGGTTPPTGYLYCDGTAVSRTQFSALFSAIGTNFGYGDGSTTFNLPDLRGRFLRGVDNNTGRDPDRGSRSASATGGNAGDNVGSFQGEGISSHNHPASAWLTGATLVFSNTPINESEAPYGLSPGWMFGDAGARGISRGRTGVAASTSAVGGETRPINIYVHYIIKY